MRCLLIYDIVHDGTRQKAADLCLDYGLERIQYSAFLGTLSRVHQKELFLRLQEVVKKKEVKIQIFPLDEYTWSNRKSIEQWEE